MKMVGNSLYLLRATLIFATVIHIDATVRGKAYEDLAHDVDEKQDSTWKQQDLTRTDRVLQRSITPDYRSYSHKMDENS